jgi:transcriptional regulator with XRE-family HTH domain
MTDTATIGRRIRDARQAKGMTQEQLAQAVNVSRSAVAQWETGRAGQVTANLARLAATLGVGVDYLTHGDDKFAPSVAGQGDELALLRLYRACTREDRQMLLRMARRLAEQAAADGVH